MDKRILKTKTLLYEALVPLLSERSIHEITVTALCKAAGVNRTTFYKYYRFPEEVLEEYVIGLYEKTLQSAFAEGGSGKEGRHEKENGQGHLKDFYGDMLRLCEMYDQNRNIIRLYLEAGEEMMILMKKGLGDAFQKALDPHGLDCFIAGGVSAILLQWSMNDYRKSPQWVAEMLSGYISKLKTEDSSV